MNVESPRPPGASIIIVRTRWRLDDLTGTLEREVTYQVFNLPEINDGTDPRRAHGAPLWPSPRRLDWHEDKRQRLGEYESAAYTRAIPRPSVPIR
ncbi:MAG: hypothetical protein AAGA56_22910, partial [Myxococcota bacterium]